MRKMCLVWAAVCALVLLGSSASLRTVLPADAQVQLPEAPKYIALTFDDGPKRGSTDVLLDGLRERGVNATFFLVGTQIAGNEDLVLRMQAEGHQIGNHTWSHVTLQDADETTIRQEIGQTEAVLSELLGGENYWVRPPYGQIRQEDRPLLPVPMIKWSLDPRDWESRNTETVLQAILEGAEANSIVLLHDIYPTSVEAALRAVDALQGQDYHFVTVEELMALNAAQPQPGVMYRNGSGALAWG